MTAREGPEALVVGLTGPNAAGKGEVAARFVAHRFRAHSLSDIVRQEARLRGLSEGRADLIRVGNQLRHEGGPGVLALRMLPALGPRDVVDSIRNPAEVGVLRTLPHFVLVGVTAPVECRFERCSTRNRPGDPRTLEEFLARELQENTADPAAQQLQATLALADEVVENAGDLRDLHRAVDELLSRLLGSTSRPR